MALESYDWILFALLVNYFAPTFFGGERSLAYGFGVFAVGFVARPIGGLWFGHLADTRGRKTAMLVCISLAGAASVGMALTPSVATIGIAAPILLLLWRLLIGLAQGGELPVAQTYLYEVSPPGRRSLFASMVYTFGGVGKLCANLLVVGIVAAVGAKAMSAGYWRVPFLLAGVAAIVFFGLRMRLAETAEFESRSVDGPDVAMWRDRRMLAVPMLSVVGVTAGVTAAFYLWTAAPSSYAISVLHLRDSSVLLAGVAATAVFVAALPLFGLLGDRIGARNTLLGGAAVMAVATFPLQHLLDHATIATYWFVVVASNLGIAALCSVLPAVLTGFLPPHYRAVGQALPYGITVAIFGGTTPLLKNVTAAHPAGFTAYIVVLLTVTVATLLLLPAAARRTDTAPTVLRVPVPSR